MPKLEKNSGEDEMKTWYKFSHYVNACYILLEGGSKDDGGWILSNRTNFACFAILNKAAALQNNSDVWMGSILANTLG